MTPFLTFYDSVKVEFLKQADGKRVQRRGYFGQGRQWMLFQLSSRTWDFLSFS
jgi:hypothetical protein